jgi:DNA-binding response OmpR family regulator
MDRRAWILDIVMPVMDGLTMLKALRKDAWGAHAQIMLLTNLSSMEKLADAAEYGVKEYIIKSDIKLDDLIIKIREKFRNS